MSIPVGTHVRKIGGSYQASGVIVGNFKTIAGEQRYVFEFDQPAGMLHIFGPSQVAVDDLWRPADIEVTGGWSAAL